MNLMSTISGAASSPWAQAAQRGYETYFGVTAEEARADAARAEAGAAIAVAQEEGRTMRILAGAGIAVALAGLLVAVVKR